MPKVPLQHEAVILKQWSSQFSCSSVLDGSYFPWYHTWWLTGATSHSSRAGTWKLDLAVAKSVALSKLALKQDPLKEKGAHGSPCHLLKALPHSKVSTLKIWSFTLSYEILLILPAWDRLPSELEAKQVLTHSEDDLCEITNPVNSSQLPNTS